MNNVFLLLPDFGLILLGALLYRWVKFSDGFWSSLEKLVYFFLFPALLFLSASTVKLELASTTSLMTVGLVSSLCGFLLGYAALFMFRPDPMLFASGLQTAYRFNSYIALAIAGRIGGDAGVALMALLVGFHVPLCNALSVYVLARHQQTNVLRELVRNPLIVSTFAGLAFNLAGLRLPEFGALFLSRLGGASIVLGLIAVGAGLRISRGIPERAMVTWFIAVKLLILPAIAWLLSRQLELPALQQQIVVMFAALPTASSAYILAVRMGGNGPIVAFLISAGTLISLVTLPAWLTLVL